MTKPGGWAVPEDPDYLSKADGLRAMTMLVAALNDDQAGLGVLLSDVTTMDDARSMIYALLFMLRHNISSGRVLTDAEKLILTESLIELQKQAYAAGDWPPPHTSHTG